MQHFSYPASDQKTIDIEKLQSGEVGSLLLLYRSLYEDMLGTAKALLIAKDEAPAIVNHCFIKCWIRSAELTSMSYTLGYLNYTVRSSCLARNCKKGHLPVNYENTVETLLCYKKLTGETPESFLAQVSGLSNEGLSQAKEVFALYYVKGLTVEEICEETGQLAEDAQDNLDNAFKVLYLSLINGNS